MTAIKHIVPVLEFYRYFHPKIIIMRLVLFITLILFLVACTSQSTEKSLGDKTENQTVQYARHFRFAKKDNATVVEILNPDSRQVAAVLSPLSENKSVIALSGTFIGMLDKLELASYISGVSEMKYIDNEIVKKNFAGKKILEAGYDTQLALEPIVAKKPALILHSGYNSEFPHQKQFENVGIRCIPVYDWREETPLGKAEWIKVYGFLYGKPDEAQELFDEIEKSYLDLKEKAAELSPSELLLSGNIIGSEWYTPAGSSFYAQLLRDANITYNYYDAKGTGSIALTQEKVLSENRHAAYWINPGSISLNDLKILNPKAVLFDAFNQQQVYCHSHNENFYWEVSSIEPDKLLADLIQIAHPEFKPERGLYFYSKLK